MLEFIIELPPMDKIDGVHCVPVLDNGNIVLVWDKGEQVLSTIGGRIEKSKGESLIETLKREAIEEAGLILSEEETTLFASWYWKKYDAYRVFYLVKVKEFAEIPQGFETTGYVITNFKTALEMIKKIEGRVERIEVIKRAGVLSGQLEEKER